jgi:hypothetical protein
VGGADFAQLLKLQLQAAPFHFKVFLDVENLGAGRFDESLSLSLKRSKNVVLLWTAGCMDRFLHSKDPKSEDFVRLEYEIAMAGDSETGWYPNIIPVYKEDFKFPELSHLPPSTQPILDASVYEPLQWVGE